jgi:hypothetical protein
MSKKGRSDEQDSHKRNIFGGKIMLADQKEKLQRVAPNET